MLKILYFVATLQILLIVIDQKVEVISIRKQSKNLIYFNQSSLIDCLY